MLDNSTLEQLTRTVCNIAKDAGDYLRQERIRFDEGAVVQKNAHDYVSYVDKTAEGQIVNELRKLLPEAGFLTEEKSVDQHHDEPYWWVVDPLDGTTNYIHGFNPYAVSIALRTGTEVLLGVIYEVTADECFYAWKGGGAWLNGVQMHVTSHDLDHSMLGIELPYDADAYRKTANNLISYFYGRCAAVRMNGSAAVALCNVAAGRWDGWIERQICQWDFMAGGLIVYEAGGNVTTYGGDDFYLDGREIVASNGIIHQQLIERTRNE